MANNNSSSDSEELKKLNQNIEKILLSMEKKKRKPLRVKLPSLKKLATRENLEFLFSLMALLISGAVAAMVIFDISL